MISDKASAETASLVTVRDLRVDYGDFVAVDEIDFEVHEGEILGFVGPNGAGKTSTFNVLATLAEPTYGSVRLAGIDILECKEDARKILGYMPDLAPVHGDLKAREFLDLYADSYGLGPAAVRRDRIDECLEMVDLSDRREAWCKKLSRGQTQRLVLAKTMLHRPRVLILDEPASGLDPKSRRDLRIALRALAAEGVGIIVSSHILGELAEMCTTLCIMHRGKLLSRGTADEVRRELGRTEHRVRIRLLERQEEAAAWLEGRPHVSTVSSAEQGVLCTFAGQLEEQSALLGDLLAAGFPVRTFEEVGVSFEDILISVAETPAETQE